MLIRMCLAAATLLLATGASAEEFWQKSCDAVVNGANLYHHPSLLVSMGKDPQQNLCHFEVDIPNDGGDAQGFIQGIQSDRQRTYGDSNLREDGLATDIVSEQTFYSLENHVRQLEERFGAPESFVELMFEELNDRMYDCLALAITGRKEFYSPNEYIQCEPFDPIPVDIFQPFIISLMSDDFLLQVSFSRQDISNPTSNEPSSLPRDLN